MGANSSTPDQFGSNSDSSQIPVPQDPVPYGGPKGNYHIIQCSVDVTAVLSGLGQVSVASNIDSHYQALSQPYGSGFRLISFYCIPYSVKRRMFSRTATFPYYGIYFHSQLSRPTNEQWQLTIVKSQMQVQVVRHGLLSAEIQGRTDQITAVIADTASRGGRLVCIENTQKRLAQTMKQAFSGLGPIQGVDVFFEMPLHPNPVIYTYTVASIPMKLHGGFQSVSVSCDWNGVFGQYLDAGWRLKEIYLDQGAATRAFSTTATMNSLWFFEKDVALLEDSRPRYQGTIVFYELKSTLQQSTVTAKTENWGVLLSSMGEKGWELACILDIPEVRTGFLKMYSTLLFFFQRELI